MQAVSHKSPLTASILFFGLLGLIAWLPVPLGSNRLWSSALMHAGSLSLLGKPRRGGGGGRGGKRR